MNIIKINKTSLKHKNLELQQISEINKNNRVYLLPEYIFNNLINSKLPINKRTAFVELLESMICIENVFASSSDKKMKINAKKWIDIFSTKTYKSYQKILINSGFVHPIRNSITNKYFEKNVHCIEWELYDEKLYIDFVIIIFENKQVVKTNINVELPSAHLNTIYNCEINIYKAINAEIRNYQKNINIDICKRINKILNFGNYIFAIKSTKSNRLYTNLCFVTKISRPFLSINGFIFKSIDIKNCQPLLLCYYLKSNGYEFEYDYQRICEEGRFYELFLDIYNNDRDKVKEMSYKSIFFNIDNRSLLYKKMNKLFPLLVKALNEIYLNNNLACELQKIEAEIFNNIKVYSGYFYTIFDAIYFTDKSLTNDIIAQINYKFSRYGILPSLEFK